MKIFYPDYYMDFKCIAEKCKHNCCIGWEIDIDQNSLDFYQNVKGDFGKRLKENISLEGTPHFILSENERCPFLNKHNLCDIYRELGENRLCQICTDHPRFYNELEDRTEAGLGLCCEEAARLIITKKEPVKFIGEVDLQGLLLLRSKIFTLLQERSKPIPHRLQEVQEFLGIKPKAFDMFKWINIFEGLERLEESWSDLLLLTKENFTKAEINAFDAFMKGRETEYEQFLCYLVYRHLCKAEFMEDAAIYFGFAVLSYELMRLTGAVVFTQNGDFTVSDQLNIMRLFSSEIEYSDENLDIILNTLETEIFGC